MARPAGQQEPPSAAPMGAEPPPNPPMARQIDPLRTRYQRQETPPKAFMAGSLAQIPGRDPLFLGLAEAETLAEAFIHVSEVPRTVEDAQRLLAGSDFAG